MLSPCYALIWRLYAVVWRVYGVLWRVYGGVYRGLCGHGLQLGVRVWRVGVGVGCGVCDRLCVRCVSVMVYRVGVAYR